MEYEKIDWSDASPEELALAYKKFRDTKRELENKAKVASQHMADIEVAMLAYMDDTGTDSFRTPVATISKTIKEDISVADWDIFLPWLYDQAKEREANGKNPLDLFSFFQKRVAVNEVRHFMEVNDGHVPPAVNVFPKYSVSVRSR